ncbi:DUF983 domain-containing protein [Novosphingobium ovatum]|uniref:DUF983 domain-containing protein n=1 Tax=Novosphingobium ovatum TaxID=1908523 RepID=UPI001D115465|nr:DUF983 domain-containing protein [Novosphingobium ovatum]
MTDPHSHGDVTARPGIASVALFGVCPRCGARGLFRGVAQFAPACGRCGLDYAAFNVGDGPAAFLTFGVGALAAVVAAWLALSVDPPVWVYVAVLVPLVVGPTLWGLRLCKGALLAAEYKRRAAEHRAQ